MLRVHLKAADGTMVELDPTQISEIHQIDGKAQVEQFVENSPVPLRIVLADTPARVARLLSAAIG